MTKYLSRLTKKDLQAIAKEAKASALVEFGDLSCYGRDEFLDDLGPLERRLRRLPAYQSRVGSLLWADCCADGSCFRRWPPEEILKPLARGQLVLLATAARDTGLFRPGRALSAYSADALRKELGGLPEVLARVVASNRVLADMVREPQWKEIHPLAKADPSAIILAVEGPGSAEVEDDSADDGDEHNRKALVGQITALWGDEEDDVGGTKLIEVAVFEGQSPPQIGGSVGDVARMSANEAWAHVRHRSADYGIPEESLRNRYPHLSFDEIADPTDGPSAGLAFVTAIVSTILGRPVIPGLAMTGAVSLKGRVMEVGAVKQKVAAAYRAGRRTVIVPQANERDIERLPELVRHDMTIHLVATAQEAVRIALHLE